MQLIQHLRRSFPATVDASILKKLGLAANNEAYNINVLKFIGVIDDSGNRNPDAQSIFSVADDAKFASHFGDLVRTAYASLFELRGDEAWMLPKSDLLTFFRQSDRTSEVVGNRQVSTFVALAELAGKRTTDANKGQPRPKDVGKRVTKSPARKPAVAAGPIERAAPAAASTQRSSVVGDVGISVKVEVILPNNADAATYENIFRAIRKNLIDG